MRIIWPQRKFTSIPLDTFFLFWKSKKKFLVSLCLSSMHSMSWNTSYASKWKCWHLLHYQEMCKWVTTYFYLPYILCKGSILDVHFTFLMTYCVSKKTVIYQHRALVHTRDRTLYFSALGWTVTSFAQSVYVTHEGFWYFDLYTLYMGAGIAQWHSAGLQAGWLEFWVSTGARNFSPHHCVQTGSGAHPASYPMGTTGSFHGDKAARAWSWPLTSI
jgi:hypothetical protein